MICKRKRARPFRSVKYAKACAKMLERMTGERCGVQYMQADSKYRYYLIRYKGDTPVRS